MTRVYTWIFIFFNTALLCFFYIFYGFNLVTCNKRCYVQTVMSFLLIEFLASCSCIYGNLHDIPVETCYNAILGIIYIETYSMIFDKKIALGFLWAISRKIYCGMVHPIGLHPKGYILQDSVLQDSIQNATGYILQDIL